MSKEWIEDVPDFYKGYLLLAEENNVAEGLTNSIIELNTALENVEEEAANSSYANGKWSLKEVLLHICDTERIFQYRMLSIARGEEQNLLGFDQDNYVAKSNANSRSLISLLEELNALRASGISLFNSLNEQTLKAKGMANGFMAQPIFYGYMLTGHMRHHIQVIKDRYL